MAKKKKRFISNVKWDSKRYYDQTVRDAQEKRFDVLVLKIIMAKALSKKEIEEFVNHYLRYMFEHWLGYDYVKYKDEQLRKLINETYKAKT